MNNIDKKQSNIPESIVLNHVLIMAQQSLDPDTYNMFCKAHDMMIDNRNLTNDKMN